MYICKVKRSDNSYIDYTFGTVFCQTWSVTNGRPLDKITLQTIGTDLSDCFITFAINETATFYTKSTNVQKFIAKIINNTGGVISLSFVGSQTVNIQSFSTDPLKAFGKSRLCCLLGANAKERQYIIYSPLPYTSFPDLTLPYLPSLDFWGSTYNYQVVGFGLLDTTLSTILETVVEKIGFDTDDNTSNVSTGVSQWEQTDNDIQLPTLPTLTANGSKLMTVYNPTYSQLIGLSGWLWTPDIITQIKALFQNIMDGVIALRTCNYTPTPLTISPIRFGNIDSDVESLTCLSYQILDCGSITIVGKWGNFLDYQPYTKISVFLPFIGFRELDTDEIINRNINIKYYIDNTSGASSVYITTTEMNTGKIKIAYIFNTNLHADIPLSSVNSSGLLNSLINMSASVGVGFAMGSAVPSIVASSAMGVINSKMNISKTGNLSSNFGALGVKKPFLYIKRPKQNLPKNYNKIYGYPTNMLITLSTLTGFTKVSSCRLDTILATANEIDEIEQLLKVGIIL